FLCAFFVVFVPVEVGASVVVEDFSIVAPVAGVVVLLGLVCAVVVACWAKATPNDRRATATRAEMVFFIFFSNPLFLWPVRGLPTRQSAQPRCHGADGRRANAISSSLWRGLVGGPVVGHARSVGHACLIRCTADTESVKCRACPPRSVRRRQGDVIAWIHRFESSISMGAALVSTRHRPPAIPIAPLQPQAI